MTRKFNPKNPPGGLYLAKAQKKLEGIDYTPQTAKILACIMCALARENKIRRDVVLSKFKEIVEGGVGIC